MNVETHLPGTTTALPAWLDGAVIGVLLGVPGAAAPVAAYPGCPSEYGLAVAITTQLSRANIDAQIALISVAGDPRQPLLIGRIQRLPQEALVQLDGEHLEFGVEREIVLRCGKAGITLTCASKVIIHGAYLSNRSTGVNRVKGGSVQIN